MVHFSITEPSHSHPKTNLTGTMSQPAEVISTTRDAPPTHYTFKIQSFSVLSKASIERYDSDIFEVEGHKWKLSFYPKGRVTDKDCIPLYLAMVDISSLSLGWEVNVIFSLFVFNQFEGNYLTFQDGSVRRFHTVKTEWGLSKFIDLTTFNDLSKGYLVNDTCVFGVEVFVIKSAGKGECLSMINGAIPVPHIWEITKFPMSSLQKLTSSSFIAGGYEWLIVLHYMGTDDAKGNSVSLFLSLNETATPLPGDTKLFTKFSLSMTAQVEGNQYGKEGSHLFSSTNLYSGWQKFMPLGEFNDQKRGFSKDSTCIIEAKVTVLGLVTKLA